jgi:uncharacterized membrane protein YhaH (DUF805 family)
MTFGQAISSVMRQYAGFTGRARRSEYLFWLLFTVAALALGGIVDSVLGTAFSGLPYGSAALAVWVALLTPTLAVTIRRLHDSDHSGWWCLLGLLCGVGGLVVLAFALLGGTPGPNAYGDPPR